MMKISPPICKMLHVLNVMTKKRHFVILNCTDAVNNLNNNKSPSLAGLPGEFYKCFWRTIKPLFYDVLLCVFEKQELPFSQRLALITLFLKIIEL